tara:strand:- start:67 stop:339 length:273 start_codon:yes stop_codon:yes gene_type:complete
MSNPSQLELFDTKGSWELEQLITRVLKDLDEQLVTHDLKDLNGQSELIRWTLQRGDHRGIIARMIRSALLGTKWSTREGGITYELKESRS